MCSSHDFTCTLLSFLELTKEFLMIYERCPSRLQKKITEPMKSQVREKVEERFVLDQEVYASTTGPNCLQCLYRIVRPYV